MVSLFQYTPCPARRSFLINLGLPPRGGSRPSLWLSYVHLRRFSVSTVHKTRGRTIPLVVTFSSSSSARTFLCRSAHIYRAPLHLVLPRMRRTGGSPFPPARWVWTIQEAASQLPRIPLPRTWVNKGPVGQPEQPPESAASLYRPIRALALLRRGDRSGAVYPCPRPRTTEAMSTRRLARMKALHTSGHSLPRYPLRACLRP